MGITSLIPINFDLLSVGVVIAGTALLGSVIFFSARHNITNRTFFYFSLLTAMWGASNYLEYRFTNPSDILWALRIHLFISVMHAFFFFRLAYVFPREKIRFPRWHQYALVPWVLFVMVAVLTPYVFSGLTTVAPAGQVTRAMPGPGIGLFVLTAFGLLISSVILLFRRAFKEVGVARRQSLILSVGMLLTALLILTFNVVLPNVFSTLTFIPLAALFIFPFVAFTSYAIFRHNLFNLKVVTTVSLGFMVSVFTFINVLYSREPVEIIVNVIAFVTVLLGSIKIILDMLQLKNLTTELEEINKRQEGLLHFIGHEVKGFLAKDANAFAALVDGDFGALPEGLKSFVQEALKQSRDGERSVTDILKASNLKKGKMSYTKEAFNLKARISEIVEKLKPIAEQKGLTLSFSADETVGSYMLVGDQIEIGDHVFRNVIDNAINYTPAGSVALRLTKEKGNMVLTVKDTGVGITDDDRKYLWTEGGHGKDSQKINVHSTGYGLYIAKKIIEDHGGTIEAESGGEGKGSTFIIKFPG